MPKQSRTGRHAGSASRVAIAIDHRMHHAAEMIIGICSQAVDAGWEVAHVLDLAQLEDYMRHRVWRPDGIISLVDDPLSVPAIARLGIPRVVAHGGGDSPLRIDELRVGAMAADHLAERGYPAFVLGFTSKNCRHPRGMGFLRRAAQLGITCVMPLERRADLENDAFGQFAVVADACAVHPHPVGLFCWNDGAAVHIINALRVRGVTMPDEVGVLGCGDEPLAKYLASLALSSIEMPFRELGAAAARLLQKRMAGQADGTPVLLPPMGVAARKSTDLRHQADPLVAKAVAFIAAHLDGLIGAEQIAAAIGANRRTLERRFRISLRRTILEEIHRQRTLVACMKLEAGEPVAQCATAVGWSISTLDEVFKSRFGTTPSAWRKRKQSSDC
jgi:LacI family transcriptional regulator